MDIWPRPISAIETSMCLEKMEPLMEPFTSQCFFHGKASSSVALEPTKMNRGLDSQQVIWAIKNTPIPSHYTSWLKTVSQSYGLENNPQ